MIERPSKIISPELGDQGAADKVHERRLARPVGPNDAKEFPFAQLEANVVDGN